MSWKNVQRTGLCLGATIIFAASAVCAPPATSTSKSTDNSKTAAHLLRDIRSDASQVRSAAVELDHLTASSNPSWVAYDRQWNIMKPAVEDMQHRLGRLEAIQSNSSSAEQNQITQSKALIGHIEAGTHELRVLLDKNGVQTNDAKFKTYASSLQRESNQLERVSRSSSKTS